MKNHRSHSRAELQIEHDTAQLPPGIQIFGQKNEDIRIKNDAKEWIGEDRHLIVIRDQLEQVGRNKHNEVKQDHIEDITRDHHIKIGGKEAISITGSHSETVTGDVIEVYQGNQSTQVTQNVYIKGMQVVIEAVMGLTIKQGPNFITLDTSGIAISGVPFVNINSGGAALSGSPGSAVSPIAPTDPADADTANAGQNDVPTATPGQLATDSALNVTPITSSPKSAAPANAPSHDPNDPENQKKKSWIEIQLNDEDGNPVPGEPYKVTLPDGTTIADGTLDNKGFARVDNIDPGTCQVTFPNLDKDAWGPA